MKFIGYAKEPIKKRVFNCIPKLTKTCSRMYDETLAEYRINRQNFPQDYFISDRGFPKAGNAII